MSHWEKLKALLCPVLRFFLDFELYIFTVYRGNFPLCVADAFEYIYASPALCDAVRWTHGIFSVLQKWKIVRVTETIGINDNAQCVILNTVKEQGNIFQA